jgi:hypothetical protein
MPRTAVADVAATRERVRSVDLVGGLVMVIMALDHTRELLTSALSIRPISRRAARCSLSPVGSPISARWSSSCLQVPPSAFAWSVNSDPAT